MGEYEVGQTYLIDGHPHVYKGGDPASWSSWQKTAPPKSGGALRTFLRAATQLPTFGFADEIEGALRPGMSIRDVQAFDKASYGKHPAAALAGGLAGGLVPGLGTAGLVKRAGVTLGAKIAAGAAAGAVEGGLFGIGAGEGSLPERMPGGLFGATAGGAVGAGGGLLGAKLAERALPAEGQSVRVGNELRRTSGAQTTYAMKKQIAAEEARVRAQFFRPLENKYKDITDPDILKIVTKDEKVAQYLPSTVRDGTRPLTYKDLVGRRGVLSQLRKAGRSASSDAEVFVNKAQEIDEMLGQKFAGHAEAMAQYLGVKDVERAYKLGRKAYQSSDDVRLALEALPSRAQREAFRGAQVNRAVGGLLRRENGSSEVLKTILDAGPETQARFRAMFPNSGAYHEFMAYVKRENDAEALRQQLKRLALPKKIAAAAKLGAGAGGAYALYRFGVSLAQQ